ncbi:MAG: HAD hydrolase family protein [Patescibacteria group bacterium]
MSNNYIKIPKKLLLKLKKLKLIGFDFDGIFTDGKVILSEDGIEHVVCSRKDGLGINELQRLGLKLIVISKEPNKIVATRSKKLKTEYAHGINDKLTLFKKILKEKKINPSEAAFMGDDWNDLECMQYAGLSFTVADANPNCKKVADYITKRKGGDHAVREICDLVVLAKEGKIK